MPRKPRLFSPDVAYHLIARGNNRQTLFKSPADFAHFLSQLRILKSEHVIDIYHYCLMPNHVHMLVRFPDRQAFRKFPQRLFLLYAKYFADRYQHIGHVFQDRFKSLPVPDNRYLLDCGRYIERNPVKAQLVNDPSLYPWSSYRFYALQEPTDLVTANPMYDDMGPDERVRADRYKQYVRVDRPYEQIIEKALFGRVKVAEVST